MSDIAFMDSKPISYTEETTDILPVTSPKQENTSTTVDHDLIDIEEMMTGSTTSLKVKLECKVCGKTFHQCDELKTHNHIHTCEKPHKCNICQKSFARLDHLSVHSRTHSE